MAALAAVVVTVGTLLIPSLGGSAQALGTADPSAAESRAVTASGPAPSAPAEVRRTVLEEGIVGPAASVTDGTFAYIATFSEPARIAKVRLSDMSTVAVVTLAEGFNEAEAAATDGTNAYFSVSYDDLYAIVKIRMSDLTQVGAYILPEDNEGALSLVVDATNLYAASNRGDDLSLFKITTSDMTLEDEKTSSPGYSTVRAAVGDAEFLYLGTNTSPGAVVKVRKSDLTEAEFLELEPGENNLRSATTDGTHVFFGTSGSVEDPSEVVKVRMSDLTRVDAANNVSAWRVSALATDSTFVYAATEDTQILINQILIKKFRISDMTEVDSLSFEPGGDSPDALLTDGTNLYAATGRNPSTFTKVAMSSMDILSTITLGFADRGLAAAVSDGTYAYFGSGGRPGTVVKVRLSDLARVGSVNTGADQLSAAVSDGTHAYFGSFGNLPAQIVKIRLSDLTVVGTLTLDRGEGSIQSAFSAGGFGYFGTYNFAQGPAKVIKVRLADMTRSDEFTLNPGEEVIFTMATDGTHAYLGLLTSPGRAVKVRLADMTRVSSLDLADDEFQPQVAFAHDGHVYFGFQNSQSSIVKIRTSDMAQVGATTLDVGSSRITSAVHDDTFGYFATGLRVTKIRLSDLSTVANLDLSGINPRDEFLAVVADRSSAYFATDGSPSSVVKVRLAPQSETSCGFTDETSIPTWAREGACWLKANNITTVNPYNSQGLVTRAQMAKFLQLQNTLP